MQIELCCDNYLEGFHIPFVHEGLNSVLDFMPMMLKYLISNLQIGIASDNDICFNLQKSIDYGKKLRHITFGFSKYDV